jgi:hypothetical protein
MHKWEFFRCPYCGTDYIPSGLLNQWIVLFSIIGGVSVVALHNIFGLNAFHVFIILGVGGGYIFSIVAFFFPKIYFIPVEGDQEETPIERKLGGSEEEGRIHLIENRQRILWVTISSLFFIVFLVLWINGRFHYLLLIGSLLLFAFSKRT